MTIEAPAPVRVHVRVRGIVQGVGFRPFVYGHATGLRLAGHVGNDGDGVFVEAEGPAHAVDLLVEALKERPPRLARVDSVTVTPLTPLHRQGFSIVDSVAAAVPTTPVTPDAATCNDCLREINDPLDRRYRYAFTNCTNCGPRFTITITVPYDRANTSMRAFGMCGDCAAEYHDPANRRFHAQPVCCPACGPRLALRHGTRHVDGDPLDETVALLDAGAIVAVKGLGGYHLACDATNTAAVARLRERKHREHKPFAVMLPSIKWAHRLIHVDPGVLAALTDRRRPIVVAAAQQGNGLAPAVTAGNLAVGVMLPYTPLHHLLMAGFGHPLVLTSGNAADEPIAHADDDAVARLSGIADAFLVSDRPIHSRADDSVVRVDRGRTVTIRRSRGYAPEPIAMPVVARRPVLGCGAELKSTFCLLRGGQAVLSHHIGDLENFETLQSYTEAIAHYQRLFAVTPEIVAYDLHPDYLSSKHALAIDGVTHIGVQHHHAHIASCLADNGQPGPVIGVAFDGTGYGADGMLWGGEILVADLCAADRVGHLEPLPLPGGAVAVRQPWRMAAAAVDAAVGEDEPEHLPVRARHTELWHPVRALARSELSASTTSAGRLFDAVAALADVRDIAGYEGQAAIELEQRYDDAVPGTYPVGVDDGEVVTIRSTDVIRGVVGDVATGAAAAAIATRFHRGLADAVATAVEEVSRRTGLRVVALSGGVFQNLTLVDLVSERLARRGLHVLMHREIPANDAGISVGQAVVAAAVDGREKKS